jgi:hypothetical protein
LAAKGDPLKPDINTQMLLAETLGAVAALARPKLKKDVVAAIKVSAVCIDIMVAISLRRCAEVLLSAAVLVSACQCTQATAVPTHHSTHKKNLQHSVSPNPDLA